MPSISFEVPRELADLAARLRATGQEGFRDELRQVVSDAARPAADAVRLAASRFSASIPDTIRVRTSLGVASVQAAVVAESSRMPPGHGALPGLEELGGSRSRGKWRHPVFGHRDRWVNQRTHPYFYGPARQAAGPALDSAVKEAADRIARKAGFE